MLERGKLVTMRSLVPFVVLLSGSIATAQVSWRGDFETGNTSQFNYLLNPTIMGRTYTSVVQDVVAGGRYAARIELHDDARWSNGLRRVEVQHAPQASRTASGATLFFAWSFRVPQALPTSPEQTIGYFESNTSYQQLMAFAVIGTDLRFSTNRPMWRAHWTGRGVVTPNVWHRVAVRVLWSTDPLVGTVDVWFDGVQVVTGAHAATLADANSAFVQMGLLRGNMNFTDVPVIYLDEALEGSSLDAVQGLGLDGGVMMPVDAGVPVMDAGARDGGRPDAGGPLDAGAEVDAGLVVVDAGSEPDAGVPTSADAGSSPDGGTTPGDDVPSGCSCGLTGGELSLVLLALVGLRVRRR